MVQIRTFCQNSLIGPLSNPEFRAKVRSYLPPSSLVIDCMQNIVIILIGLVYH